MAEKGENLEAAMTRLLVPAKSARVGSNLKDVKAIGARLERQFESRLKPRARARRALRRQRKDLISKSAAKQAAAIIAASRTEFDQAFLDANGDRDRIARAKDATRQAMNRALSKHVPGFRRYRAAQKAYLADLRASRTLAGAGPIHQALDVNLGDLVLSSDLDHQEFGAPYELFSCELWGDPMEVFDASFADPYSGLLVQNIRFEHHNNGWSVPIEYNPTLWEYAVTVVGINYVVPRTGRLSCAAVLQNHYNHVRTSVTDDYGFSHADARADHGILIRVVRSGEWTVFSRSLVLGGLISFGSELSYDHSDIQTTTPYTLRFMTDDVFLKGERIQILAGSHIEVESYVDDMSLYIDSAMIWKLKMLRIGMHD